jgi:[acyl-carrier-protein] S-malonyltransferase
VRGLLVQQVTGSVRWEESVQRIASMGITRAVEVGAGSVLAGLVKRIAPSIGVYGAGDPESISQTVAQLSGAQLSGAEHG